MKISIFGMGYVGVVSGACLLRDGHHVCGVDPVESKVADLAAGHSPIHELGVPEMLAAGHADGRLTATTDPVEGVRDADMIWICVGTPSESDGGINLSYVEAALKQIGEAMASTGSRPLIVLRSTSLPGTTAGKAIPTLEAATGGKVGEEFEVVFHPEFLREGTAVADFDEPPKIVIGEATPGSAARLLAVYEKYPSPRFCLELGEAEMVKYCDNLFHALKLTFANEVAQVAKSVGVDSRKVAEVYCADKKLNISTHYLKPGFAYGGSCLPKDLKAILRFASTQALNLPMLQGVLESNVVQIDNFVRRVMAGGPDTVGMVGLAFKRDTDDMRESPYVKVAKMLVGEGVDLKILDPCVQPDKLIGANKEQVQRALKHLEKLLVDSTSDLDDCDAIIINHNSVDAAQVNAWLAKGIKVMDLANIADVDRHADGYEGIYW
jgi:GDP-mannose 6-dehydrogenase